MMVIGKRRIGWMTMIEHHRDHIIFYVYRQAGGAYKLVGRIVYESSQLAPLKFEYWASTKVNALNLGDSFTKQDEFLKRILAAKELV
jgi:hypothetical protein